MVDVNPEALKKAEKGIEWSVNNSAQKGLIQDKPNSIMGRMSYDPDLQYAKETQWITETVLEKEDLKKDLFQELEKIASNAYPKNGSMN